MRMVKILLFTLLFISIQSQTSNHFFVTTGKESTLNRGDQFHRQIFEINVPQSYSGFIYIRMFDADNGGNHDEITTASKMRYSVYNHFDYTNKLHIDSIISDKPLSTLVIGDEARYDNQWNTLSKINASMHKRLLFIVDGFEGKSSNLYRLSVSSDEFRNIDLKDIEITSPVLSIRPAFGSKLTTQIYFDIPHLTEDLNVHLFDADAGNKIFFESPFRRFLKIKSSLNALSSTTSIKINENERDRRAAIIFSENRLAKENFQIFLTNSENKKINMSSNIRDLRLNNLPELQLNILPVNDCYSMALDASKTKDKDGDKISYKWLLPDGIVKTGQSIIHDFTKAGRFPIQIELTDGSGQIANKRIFTKEIWVNEAPRAVIKSKTIAVPDELIVFDASESTDSDGKIISYEWLINDNIKKSGKIISQAFKYPGSYSIKLTVNDNGSNNCTSHVIEKLIIINAPPIPVFSLPSIAGVNESILLSANESSDSDGKISKFEWTISNGTTIQGKNVYTSFEKAGLYTINLDVLDNANTSNSSAKSTLKLRVNAEPIAKIKAVLVSSTLDKNVFSAYNSKDSDGNIVKYEWSFGDGSSGTGVSATHQYTNPGVYDVNLKVTDNTSAINNFSQIQHKIRINSPPVPNAGFDRTLSTNIANFDASSSYDSDDEIIDYIWDFGDGTIKKGKLVKHLYRLPGLYNVKLTVVDGSNTKTKSQSTNINVRLNRSPIADAGLDINVSPNEEFQFDASQSIDSDGEIKKYLWDLADGRTKTSPTFSSSFTEPGLYHVRLIVFDNNGSSDEDIKQVFVNAKPVIVLETINKIAPNQKITLDASRSFDKDGKINEVIWSINNEKKSGLKVTSKFSEPGVYPVIIEAIDNAKLKNSSIIQQTDIKVNYMPIADAGEDVFTDKLNISLDASKSYDKDNSNLSYKWNMGDGTELYGESIKHRYKKPGRYPVTLLVDDQEKLSNSISNTSITVQINSTPIAKITAKYRVCASEKVFFSGAESKDADNDLLKYEWDFGDGVKSTGVSPIHKYTSSGTYTVTLKTTDSSNQSNGSSITTHLIDVSSAPVANAGIDMIVCANTVVNFDASASIGGSQEIESYSWNFGDNNKGGGVKTTNVFKEEGVYTVRLTVKIPGGDDCETSSTDEITVTVLPSPKAVFQSIAVAADNEIIQLDASESNSGSLEISDYIWDLGDGSTKRGKIIEHVYQNPGKYKITLNVRVNTDQKCNKSEFSRLITINEKPKSEIKISSIDANRFLINEQLNFTGNNSRDEDGKIKSFEWKINNELVSNNIEFNKRFERAGDYNISLKVVDNTRTSNNGDISDTTITIHSISSGTIISPVFACLNEAVEFELDKELNGYWQINGVKVPLSENKKTISIELTKLGHSSIQYITESHVISQKIEVLAISSFEIYSEADQAELSQSILFSLKASNIKDYNISWKLDDQNVDAKLIYNHKFVQAGKHKISVRFTHKNLRCINGLVEKEIFIFNKPELEILVDSKTAFTGGIYDATEFVALVESDLPQLSYQWNIGSAKALFGKATKFKFQKAGIYTIKLTVWNSKDKNAIKHTVVKKVEIIAR